MKQLRDRYDNQDDATLIASVLAGERVAFDILLARYSSSVLQLCTALLGNTFEAQDIVQEASLQAFLGLARLDDLVELQIDSLRILLLIRQHLVILRDPQAEHG